MRISRAPPVFLMVLPVCLSELEAVLIQDKILIAPKIPIWREARPPDSGDDPDVGGDNDVRFGGASKKKRNIRNSAKEADSNSDFDL